LARRYHHVGIPAEEPCDGEVYLEVYDTWVSGFEESPFGVERMRYGSAAPLPDLVKRMPHVAFEVDDLEAELAGQEVIIQPNRPSEGVTVAFIDHRGAPVEFLQFDDPADPRRRSGSPFLPSRVHLASSLPANAFHEVAWEQLPAEEHPGDSGTSQWRTFQAGGARTRAVEYSPGFESDHACPRGHILYVIEGEIEVDLQDGQKFTFGPGQGFVAGDDEKNPHRARAPRGAKVFIVD
jgi:quercetin dioxygenase-like cupin family protein